MITKTLNTFLRCMYQCICTTTAIISLSPLTLPAAWAVDFADSAVELTRTYEGADGSAFSTRAVGNTVVGYSEDASGQKAFVFIGTRSGMVITGQYYGVAKGATNVSGPLVLTYSNGGSTLTRTGGNDIGPESWQAHLPSQFSYPKAREAGFQSISATDLDGAFKGDDGSRAYVGQYGSSVVYMTERFASPTATRPLYASIIIAQKASNSLTGMLYDLPKQTASLRYGPIVGQVTSSPRSFTQTLSANGNISWVSFAADYAVDLDLFAQTIENSLRPFTVGFSYAIAQDGKVVRSRADGARRLLPLMDEEETNYPLSSVPFTKDTLNEVASTTKTVTLVAVLRALREHDISVDSPVSPYLPANWTRGVGMNTVTFRQLLSHGRKPTLSNGLSYPGKTLCSTDFYGCLQDAVASGMTAEPKYNNIHYTIFRVILPFIIDPEGMAELFATETNETVLNEQFSAVFRDEIRSLLASAGVTADFAYEAGAPAAYGYVWGTPPTLSFAPTGSETDYLEAGSGGLKMTAGEFVQFLSRLEKGLLIAPEDLTTAKEIGFGGTGPMDLDDEGASAVGPVWGKNGGITGAASQAMIFPGTEVFVTQNSTAHPTQMGNATMLKQAWLASLVNASN